MAENGNGSDAAAEAAAERKPTERVILKAEQVLVLPDGFDVAALKGTQAQAEAALMTLAKGGSKTRGHVGEAWVEVGRHVASTKTAAIEMHAGKPGTPDAKLGTFRAPTLTAWKDGVRYDAPPLPLVERSAVE